jgi:peptide/nickel transport system ATP-binding protein
MINDLKTKFNTSMILITHDLGVVAQTCDDVAVIYAGQIVEFADKYELYDHPAHPYTQGLFASLPSMSEEMDRLKPIGGMPPDPTDLPDGCAFAPRCPRAAERCTKGEIPFAEIAPGHYCRCCQIKTEE